MMKFLTFLYEKRLYLLLIFINFIFLFVEIRAEEIKLKKENGIFTLPVLINNSVKLNFIIDTGASETLIPIDVILTLTRSNTIDDSNVLTSSQYVNADGDISEKPRVLIKSLKVGNKELNNITAAKSL